MPFGLSLSGKTWETHILGKTTLPAGFPSISGAAFSKTYEVAAASLYMQCTSGESHRTSAHPKAWADDVQLRAGSPVTTSAIHGSALSMPWRARARERDVTEAARVRLHIEGQSRGFKLPLSSLSPSPRQQSLFELAAPVSSNAPSFAACPTAPSVLFQRLDMLAFKDPAARHKAFPGPA